MGSCKSLSTVFLLLIVFQASTLASKLDDVDKAIALAQEELDKGHRKYAETNDYFEFNYYYSNLLQQVANRPTNTLYGSNALYLRSLKKALLDYQKYVVTRENLIEHMDQQIREIDRLMMDIRTSNGMRRRLSFARVKLLNARNSANNAGRMRAIKEYSYFNANLPKKRVHLDDDDDWVEEKPAKKNPGITAKKIVSLLRNDRAQLKTLASYLRRIKVKDTNLQEETDDNPF